MKAPRSFIAGRVRHGFTLIELLVVLVIAGVVGGLSAGKFHAIMIQQRVARAATAVQNDLESAFATAARNRRPIRIRWSSSSLQVTVTDRSGANVYRRTNLGRDSYGLTAADVNVSDTPVDVYPNGLADDTLMITFSVENVTKRVRMSRAGLVTIQ
jgi:prepilin-type N-terminal cleavage/methylation domain-containing protein